MNGFIKVCSFMAVVVMTMTVANAADVKDQNDAGLEFGVGLGQAHLQGSIAGVGRLSDNGTGYNAFVGYRFVRYLSVEAGYLDGGTHSFSASDGTDSARIDFHPRAAQFSAVGAFPIGDYFSLFGRVGVDHWWLRTSVSVDDAAAAGTDTTTSFMWGAGASVFVDRAVVRLEYQQSKDNEDLGTGLPSLDIKHRYISASIVWLF